MYVNLLIEMTYVKETQKWRLLSIAEVRAIPEFSTLMEALTPTLPRHHAEQFAVGAWRTS
jgi:hypothetical protein